ncbi:MAG: VIT domain-containing protein, partial [Gemmatimonadales bacterium]
VTVDGRVARIEVEEHFRNFGGGIAEGTYLYPLPGEAVFENFSLWMGGEEIRGEMLPADEARGIYEEIVRRLKDPALLSLEDHGLIRARVFPIQPGETRKVVLRYTQVLERAGDALRLRYAIGNRDRGLRPAPGGGDNREFPDAFNFQLEIENAEELGTPYSPTHEINTDRDAGRLRITLDPEASGDVELFIPYRRGLVGTSVVTHAPAGEDGYFMLLVAPPADGAGVAIPRDLTLVVDVSGSMSGTKLEQAKAALNQALGTLSPGDRFSLVSFSSSIRPFREGFTPVTPENISAAREFVDGLVANGGTNISGALEAVLEGRPAEGRLSLVVFMTDGLPSVGERSPERIAADVAGRIGERRLFTFGVGHDVNTYLVDRLAVEGRGSAAYVLPQGEIEIAMGELLARLQYPALTDLRIAGQPVEFDMVYPSTMPDLFYGEELVLLGRYSGAASGRVVIEGERAGRTERFTATAEFPRRFQENDFLPRLWASRRIGELTRTMRLEGTTPERIEEVRKLGLRY